MNTNPGSSPARTSSVCWNPTRSRSAWTARAAGANVFVERLWRSIKYENVYLHANATLNDAKAGIGKDLTFCNEKRPHGSLDGQVPDTVYFDSMPPMAKAA